MKIILVLIAVSNGAVTTISQPLDSNVTMAQCETIAEAGIKALKNVNDDAKFVCMESN